MKKWLLVLGMITCLLGVSACGKAADAADTAAQPLITEEAALTAGDQLVESISMICAQGQQDQYAADATIAAALTSWSDAMADMGDYVKILDHTAEINEDSVTVLVTVEGTTRNAKVEIILDSELGISSITTSIVYSFGELMYKAALNTLLGMGTVFVVLILISLIIYCFIYIPKIQAAFTKKADAQAQTNVKQITAPVIPIETETIETEADDFELAAVIAAALAASAGTLAASAGTLAAEGFVVRSIRKRRTI